MLKAYITIFFFLRHLSNHFYGLLDDQPYIQLIILLGSNPQFSRALIDLFDQRINLLSSLGDLDQLVMRSFSFNLNSQGTLLFTH